MSRAAGWTFWGANCPRSWSVFARTGPLALADVEGDGDLDLFVGGRVVPGRYPEAASSQLFRFDGTQFQLDHANSKALENLGLVSGAVWSDLDGDGLPELILACDWGPVRIFRNDHGKLAPWDPPVAFSPAASELLQPETRSPKQARTPKARNRKPFLII